MKIYICLVFVLIACSGCGGSNDGRVNPLPTPTPTPTPVVQDLVVKLVLLDGSGQELTSFSHNESIEFELSLTNNSADTATLNFGCSAQYDFFVLNSTDEEVWRWSTDRPCDTALTELVLTAGATEIVSEIWLDQILSDNVSVLALGDYTAIGSFLDQSEEAKIDFSVQ